MSRGEQCLLLRRTRASSFRPFESARFSWSSTRAHAKTTHVLLRLTLVRVRGERGRAKRRAEGSTVDATPTMANFNYNYIFKYIIICTGA